MKRHFWQKSRMSAFVSVWNAGTAEVLMLNQGRTAMELTVNGNTVTCKEGISLETFIMQEQYDKSKIAVEVNGGIVPKAEYENCILGPADTLEIVTFVGGG